MKVRFAVPDTLSVPHLTLFFCPDKLVPVFSFSLQFVNLLFFEDSAETPLFLRQITL